MMLPAHIPPNTATTTGRARQANPQNKPPHHPITGERESEKEIKETRKRLRLVLLQVFVRGRKRRREKRILFLLLHPLGGLLRELGLRLPDERVRILLLPPAVNELVAAFGSHELSQERRQNNHGKPDRNKRGHGRVSWLCAASYVGTWT